MSRDGARVGARRPRAPPAEPIYHFDKADVVVVARRRLPRLRSAAAFGISRTSPQSAARHRRPEGDEPALRVESTPTLTGAKADHRLALKASEIEGFARQLAGALGSPAPSAPGSPTSDLGNAGHGEVGDRRREGSAGAPRQVARRRRRLPAGRRARARARDEPGARQRRHDGHLRRADRGHRRPIRPRRCTTSFAAMDAGQVEMLVILGGEPGLHRPGGPEVRREAGQGRRSTIYHGLYVDETAYLCHWNVPDAHPLESWGDARALRRHGHADAAAHRAALRRALGARSARARSHAQPDRRGYDIVKDYWTRAFARRRGWTLRRRERAAVQERRRLLEHAPARRIHQRHGARGRRTSDAICRGTAPAAVAATAAAAVAAAGGARTTTAGPRATPAATPPAPVIPPRCAGASAPPDRRAVSRSSSGRTRRSGTAGSRTTAGCRSCPSR